MLAYVTKDPDAALLYTIDWTAWLGTDTISVSTWTVPSGLTKVTESVDGTLKKATVKISGGQLGKLYEVVNRIVSAGGLTEERTLLFTIQER